MPNSSELKLTHLDKIFWEEEGTTKGDLLRYYAAMAPIILPYLQNRPVVLNRFPEGILKKSFYQKNMRRPLPRFVKTCPIEHQDKNIDYLLVQNPESLLYAINTGSIELHTFLSSKPHLKQPDYLIFDLDPEKISFDAVIETALVLHELLDEIKAPNYCKTSGKSGLHIYVPLHASYSYETARTFALLIANLVHQKLPKITSLERMPSKRQKKVYIDCFQNAFGQLMVSPYSVRGELHATVSTPLLWKEVKSGLDPRDFTLHTIPKRVERIGDCFCEVLNKKTHLERCLKCL